jgi:hypothetical protein
MMVKRATRFLFCDDGLGEKSSPVPAHRHGVPAVRGAGIIAQTTARTRTINFGDVSQFQSEMSHNFKSENSLIAENSDGTVTFTMEDEDSMNSANKDSSNQAMKM